MSAEIKRDSLPRQIAKVLREEILSRYRTGDILPADAELTKRFGVSSLTLRQSMGLLAAEGVIERGSGRRSKVASLSSRQHVAIASSFDFSHPLLPYFFRKVVQRLSELLGGIGCQYQCYTGSNAPWDRRSKGLPRQFIQDVAENKVKGVFAVGLEYGEGWLPALSARGIPVVGTSDGMAPSVFTDFGAMRSMGLQRLIELGRKRIAVIGWAPEIGRTGKSVRNSIFSELESLGVAVVPEWISLSPHPSMIGSGWNAFMEAWKARKEKPDGILVEDDILYHEVSAAILELNARVPDELAVISHSNKGSGLFLPFPTELIEFDPDSVANRMFGIYEDLLAGIEVPARNPLQPQLICSDTSVKDRKPSFDAGDRILNGFIYQELAGR